MNTLKKTPLAAAISTAVVSTLTAPAVNAEVNPFGITELSEGYMQLAEADKPGEMKCGAGMGKKEGACGEGKCASMMDGDKMKKGMENVCGEMMKGKEGKCGMKNKAKEGKCGEGKCGAMMEGDKMKKGMDGQCGEMMKGKEGKCGMKKKQSGWPIKQ